MRLIKKILKIAIASKMVDDYGVFPAAMYLANSKPDADDEICDIIVCIKRSASTGLCL